MPPLHTHLQALCGDSLVAHPTRHAFALHDPARVLASSRGTHLAVGLGDPVGGWLTFHVVSLHHALEALADAELRRNWREGEEEGKRKTRKKSSEEREGRIENEG